MPRLGLLGDLVSADFVLSEVLEDDLADRVASELVTKGFCVIDQAVSEDVLERVRADVRSLEETGRFQQPPELVADGLLGAEGSGRIVELEDGEVGEVSAGAAYQGLREVDAILGDFGSLACDASAALGFDVSHRTNPVVHESGFFDDPPDLTEKDVTHWLDKFVRHKIMAIVFPGPAESTLRLQVYADEDSEAHEIRTRPGTMVLLRPDIMSHNHTARGRTHAISSFYVGGGAYQKRHPTGGWIVCPPAAALDQWAMGRIEKLKSEVRDEEGWDGDLPREWQRAMNLYFCKGHMTSIGGFAGKFPGCWSVEPWFQSLIVAPDVVTEVPQTRWDHEYSYDPGPESWRQGKTYSKHGGFMDGVDLFDNKFFGLSIAESKGMDPNQRHLLEMAYDALHRMGKRKNTLMNAPASCYAGNQAFEFSFVTVPKECQGCGPTGMSGCIAANRVSFLLGLKGPSMGVDTDTCSSMSALYLTAESVQRKGRGKPADFGVALGCATMLTPLWWHQHCATGWMSRKGRCLTFDAAADGYARSEACVGAAMRPYAQIIDGASVVDEEAESYGLIAGIAVNSNGGGARLSAPSGEAEQELMSDAVRNAGISPLDIDAVEAHGIGSYLGDVVETSSLMRVHRLDDEQGFPLMITSVKSSSGSTMESGGISSLVKVVLGAQFGTVACNLHLREVNPHMDLADLPVSLPTESIDLWRKTNFSGVMSKGFGGTNGYCITWGSADDKKVQSSPGVPANQICFWPAGGGSLEAEQRPEGDYCIVGSWSDWTVPEAMEEESADVFGYTLTLGDAGWEQFQIWLDGDPQRVLHPGQSAASTESLVLGPDEDMAGPDSSWLLDGASASASPAARARLLGGADASGAQQLERVGHAGDRYRVRLTIAGRWRHVGWERIGAEASGS